MPLHDYECGDCRIVTEIHLSIHEGVPPQIDCPKCGSRARLRVSAPLHIHCENQMEFEGQRWKMKQFDRQHERFINPKNFKRNSASRPLKDRTPDRAKAIPLHRRVK